MRRILLLAALTAVLPVAARADCPPLHILNTVKLESADDGTRQLVPVIINGTPEKLILDTGGAATQIAAATAQALGLRLEESRAMIFDLYGHGTRQKTTVKTFQVGNAAGQNFMMYISATPSFDHDSIGLLTTSMFAQYDMDLDFGAGRMNFFDRDHCDGKVVYWPERPLSVVPFTKTAEQLTLTVKVDGHDVRAMLDTGAPVTVLPRVVAAESFGLALDSPGVKLIHENKDGTKYYSYPFKELSFEGLTVSNPDIIIMADKTGEGAAIEKSTLRGTTNESYNHVSMQHFIIGMDILKRLHLYIAYQEGKLYITPAGTGESVLFRQPADAAAAK